MRHSVDTTGARGPFTIEVQLWYQSIAYRWAENLRAYRAAEPRRFVSYYGQIPPASAVMLTRTSRIVEKR